MKQKVNEFQILLKISSHEVAEFPLSLTCDQEYSTESTKKGRNPPGKGPRKAAALMVHAAWGISGPGQTDHLTMSLQADFLL